MYFAERPSDRHLLTDAVKKQALEEMGVKRAAVPNREACTTESVRDVVVMNCMVYPGAPTAY